MKGEFIFPIEDGRIKPLGGDQDLRTPTLIRQRPVRGESHLDFLRESEGSVPPPSPQISLKHEWKRELGSDHAQRAEAGHLSRSF